MRHAIITFEDEAGMDYFLGNLGDYTSLIIPAGTTVRGDYATMSELAEAATKLPERKPNGSSTE